jgi:recombinational DNA repair protein RecR
MGKGCDNCFKFRMASENDICCDRRRKLKNYMILFTFLAVLSRKEESAA